MVLRVQASGQKRPPLTPLPLQTAIPYRSQLAGSAAEALSFGPEKVGLFNEIQHLSIIASLALNFLLN